MIGLGVGIDYALFILTRFRNGLDEGLEPRDGGDRRGRHRRPRRALRRGHGDHLADGDAAARPHLPLRGGDGGGARGAVHDDRGADPAAGAADDRRPPGRPAAHPRPRQARAVSIAEDTPLVPLEPRDPAPARCSRRCSPAACCSPSASRPSRCGSAPTTPAPTRRGRRRAKPTTCSPKASAPASTGRSRSSRRCPSKGDDAALDELQQDARRAKKASPKSTAGRRSTRPRTPASSRSTRRPRRRARTTTDLLDHIRDDVIPPIEAADRRPGPRRRHHRDLRGLRQRDLRKAAALHRRRRPALGAAADDRLPLGAGAAEGDA